MPLTQATEKAEGGPALLAEPSQNHLMSPMGYIVVAGVMALTAGIVYFVTATLQDTQPKGVLDPVYEEMDLGQFSRELAPDTVTLVRDQFMVKIVLVLNSNYKKLAEMKGLVEKRKNWLKDSIWREILYPKSDADLRKAGILDALAAEIKQNLNAMLGASKEGQEMISRVLIPESRLPARR